MSKAEGRGCHCCFSSIDPHPASWFTVSVQWFRPFFSSIEVLKEVGLTLGDDQRRVEEEISHQLSRQLVEEPAGDGSVEQHVLVLHHIHQRD